MAEWQVPGLPALPKIPMPHDWHKSSTLKRTGWTGTMGISVVTSVDKGLAGTEPGPGSSVKLRGRAESPSSVRGAFPPPGGKGTVLRYQLKN